MSKNIIMYSSYSLAISPSLFYGIYVVLTEEILNSYVVLMHGGVCHKLYFQYLAPISIHGKASHSKEVSVVLECSLHY